MSDVNRVWYKALELDELPEGRVKPVTCGLATVCMTHYQGQYAALDNECPHQKGPLGEGSIEKGFLRCPWHGWDYHPLTGKPPGGYDDGVQTYTVESRDDGIYVAFDVAASPLDVARTISDVMVETMVNWGVRSVFGMVGHSNLGLAEALRHQHEAGEPRYFFCTPRGRGLGRGVRLRKAHRPSRPRAFRSQAPAPPTYSRVSGTRTSTGRRHWL